MYSDRYKKVTLFQNINNFFIEHYIMKTEPGSDSETQTIFSPNEDPFADIECNLDLPLIASLPCPVFQSH
jgi:hypothetical protein